MTLERQLALISTHKPTLALTLSERASSYCHPLSCLLGQYFSRFLMNMDAFANELG